jgi:hypothetical protein
VEAGRKVLFLPEDRLFPDFQFAWQRNGRDGGFVEFGEHRVDLSNIEGVLSRSYGIPVSAERFETKDGSYVSAEWNALLMAWLWRLPCRVVNRLRPELWYRTSLYVSDMRSLVPRMPFRLPRALVATRSSDVESFCAGGPGPVWYTPLTQHARFAVRGSADVAKLRALEGVLPFQLVERVDGTEFDAFVIGDAVVLVDSQGEVASVPLDVKRHCVDLARMVNLAFFRLQLVRVPGGDWYCLELDRLPQLVRCLPETCAEITRRLAGFLMSSERDS